MQYFHTLSVENEKVSLCFQRALVNIKKINWGGVLRVSHSCRARWPGPPTQPPLPPRPPFPRRLARCGFLSHHQAQPPAAGRARSLVAARGRVRAEGPRRRLLRRMSSTAAAHPADSAERMAFQERVIHPPQRYLRNTKHCILWLYFVIREVMNNSSRNFWKIITRNVKYGYWGSKIVRFKTYLFPNPQGGRRSGWCLKTVIIRNRQLPITPYGHSEGSYHMGPSTFSRQRNLPASLTPALKKEQVHRDAESPSD
nr:uncharacterized protein LOC106848227 [Equus asinus]